MLRRSFVTCALATGAMPTVAFAETGWRRYEITTSVTLDSAPGSALLFVPVAGTAGSWQQADAPTWRSNGTAGLVRDAHYGAQMLRAVWGAQASSQQIEIVQTVAVRGRGPEPATLSTAERAFWTAPAPSIPTDGIVRETALSIVAGRNGERQRLRAIYDWVVDNTWRNAATPGCGTGDIRAMLTTGTFGGKCADINSLAVGLCRAVGLPARDVYGIRVARSDRFASLGHTGDISKAQHCRAEVFLDGTGWFPIDPADVRKVVLEEHLPLASDGVSGLREQLFGHWDMNWVAYNNATDLVLPGAGANRPDFAFLMYPCAFTSAGQPSCVDPEHFRYRIGVRQV
jgi:transglutaminase-like putative cysteine protease